MNLHPLSHSNRCTYTVAALLAALHNFKHCNFSGSCGSCGPLCTEIMSLSDMNKFSSFVAEGSQVSWSRCWWFDLSWLRLVRTGKKVKLQNPQVALYITLPILRRLQWQVPASRHVFIFLQKYLHEMSLI